MKLKNLTPEEYEELFKIIDACDGNIYLIHKEMYLNLKSKLSQYFSLGKLFSDTEILNELEIKIEKHEDIIRLAKFLLGTSYIFMKE